MPLYDFCVACCAVRACTYVRTNSSPWVISGTRIPRTAWLKDVGTLQVEGDDGWDTFRGIGGFPTVGMRANMSPAVGSTIDWYFTARSAVARDIQSGEGSVWTDSKATPNLTFYPGEQRYHIRFVSSASNSLRLRSEQGDPPEHFEVADDMTYTVTAP